MNIHEQLVLFGEEMKKSREYLYPYTSLHDLAINHIGISDRKLRAMEQGQVKNIFDLVKVAQFYKWKEIQFKL